MMVYFVDFISSTEAAVHQYQIEVDQNLSGIRVEICFDGKVPDYLTVDSSLGNEDLIELPDSKQGNIEIQGRYWKTGYLPRNACLNYQVNIERHHTQSSKKSTAEKKSDKVTTENLNNKPMAYIEENTWLWLPETLKQGDDIELNIVLPKGVEISTPWQRNDLSQNRFMLGHQPQEWGYTLVLGNFSHRFTEVSPRHHLSITSLKDLPKREQIDQWLTDIAKAVKRYLGDYPTKQTQIIVISKNKRRQGPVPWGDFSRGNGFGIRFVVVPSYEIEEFYQDWTATHEFSHQLLPKVGYNDIWLSEGLASYLQYVLMGQSGVLTQEQAWLRIYQGLQRGEQGTKKVKNEPLSATSNQRKRGGRSGRTMRIYWSGALYFLKADIALREQSKGTIGLNHILLKLNRCCIKGSKVWDGDELAEQLDHLSNSKIFSELYLEFSNGVDFPSYDNSFEKLGVVFSEQKEYPVLVKENSIASEIMR